jgi:hypothetical protein
MPKTASALLGADVHFELLFFRRKLEFSAAPLKLQNKG